ncbi:putative Nitrilase/cyanide hydratase and apolipoprotein N-acyltransferase [Candidatus Zixiibacteriota bacterium]|nr:putative Nitrilase/cyanide hydratase and apolipoprotein N-acyltransferase [candidate division Zixibacteria bacterium]
MLIKVCAVQSRLGDRLSTEERLFIFKQRPDFVCLPEYCLIGPEAVDFIRPALDVKENLALLKDLSGSLNTCLIGGSVVEADNDLFYNSSYVFDRGDIIGRYRKLNPVSGEIAKGILPGDRIFVKEIDDIKIGILICADALNPVLFGLLGEYGVDIIFIPTTSPYRPGESRVEKHKRDNDIYLSGAQEAGAFIVKCCGAGQLFGKPLQGRSLIAAPWGIVQRVDISSEMDPCILTGVFDITELREFRDKKKHSTIDITDSNL